MKGLRYGLTLLLAMSVLLLLHACGGGGGSGSGSSLPPQRPVGAVNGNAVDAVIVDGTVNVYAYQGGIRGPLLGSAVTDEEGYYSLDLRTPSQPILIEISGGSYIEEASGQSVNLEDGQVLRAVTHFQSGQPLDVMVTPLTNLAAGLAAYKINNGTSVVNAVTEASTAISTIFGLDILSTYPRNITDVRNATVSLTDEHLYGFWTAAISSWTALASTLNGTQPHTVWNSIALAQVMYNDISADGLLDGKGRANNQTGLINLGLGTVLLGADVYRQAFAQHMLNMAKSARNKTGLDASQLMADANNLAMNTHAAFGGAVPIPLDEDGPVITAIEPEGQYHNGIFQFDVGVSDFVGVVSVRFDVDGAILDFASDPLAPSINIDTTVYSDGAHLIGVQAIDKLGNETYRQFSVLFDNTLPFVNITSDDITNKANFTLTGTYSDNGIGVQSITAQGRAAVLLADGTWSVAIVLQNGINSIPIIITDILGNIREDEALVALDVVKPIMNPVVYSLAKFSLSDGTSFDDNLINADGGSAPLYFETDKLDLNGVPYITTSLSASEIPYIAFTVEDSNVNGVYTPPADLVVRQQYTLSNKVLSSWQTIVPANNSLLGDFYVVPLATEALHPNWYLSTPDELHLIEIQIEDNAGNIRNFTFSFKADFIVPEPVITAQDIGQQTFTNTSFANRSQLHNANIATTAYTFTNDTGKSFLISLSENATHSVINTVEEAIREHQVRLKISTEWQARFYNLIPTLVPQGGISTYLLRCELESDWQFISSIRNYSGTNYVIQTIPSPTYGSAQVTASDQLPADPSPSSWAAYQFDSNYKTFGTLTGFADYAPTNRDAYAYIDSIPICSENGNYFQQRSVYTYESLSGYPKNNYSSFTESATFSSSTFLVEDSLGNIITPTNGWYQIPAGETVTIKKIVKTPTIAVYDDTDVADPTTFSSYTTRQYDKTITWTVDSAITITRVHDAGATKAFAMTALSSNSGLGTRAYQVTR